MQTIIAYSAFYQPETNTGHLYLRVEDGTDIELALDSASEFAAMVDVLSKHANVGYDPETKTIGLKWRRPGTN
jgi:hypothetical protein